MRKCFRRLLALCLCLAMISGMIPAITSTIEADAAVYSSYTTIARVPTQSPCSGMQGMDTDGTYIYCAKIDDDTTATIARVHKDTGALTWLTNAATGTKFFSQLYHANDLAVCTIDGVKTLFVGTGGAGMGDYSLVRLALDGTTLKQVGHYNMKHNGTSKYIAGAKVVAISSTEVTLVLKSGNYVFAGKVPINATSGDVAIEYLGKLDFSAVNFGGTIRDLSAWTVQGFGYKDNKLFVPMTGNHQDSTRHISAIICFDIDGMKGGTLKPDPSMSAYIVDSTYPDLFEIESCAISSTDGKLYFGTNGRKTSSDGNWDGVHVLNGFTYDPAMGDSKTGQNYHFRPSGGKLKSVTTGASVFNSVLQHGGQISSANKITGGTFSLDMPIILKHNEPWILTWESSNWTSHSLFLSTYDMSGYPGNQYLYRRSGSGLIALGYQGDGQYHNYGVNLSSHGIDDTQKHKYQLKNVVNSDGTNMVYLWVDGTNLGAMNNYYVGATSQSKTNNWVSGKDFSFSYIGTPQHTVSGTLQSLQVWTQGNINAFDEPNVFRWETQSDKMTSISQFGYTNNNVTALGGSCTNGTYASYYSQLTKPVVLMHNRPWVVEWKTPSWSGNTMLFSSGDTALKMNASYLYRSKDIVALGYCDGSTCHSYGIMLADHGISATGGHTYRLTNKLNADGTNMVYLTVDGQELGPMNRYYLGSEYQGATSDFASGKDFTFPYIGNYQYGLNQAYDYIQVWENGIPAADPVEQFRWEASGSSFKNITSGDFTANTANRVIGSISGGVFNEATYRLDSPAVLRHDQPWSVSWKSSGTWAGSAGGGFLLSASQINGEVNAPYLYRRKESGMIGIGYYNGSQHVQYGLQLSDFGIDGTASHEYTLQNRIHTDGSNMVYLSVDGVELGAMNQYFVGAAPKGTTSNWLSGKDFTFPYLGTPRFPLSNFTLNYLQIDEGTSAQVHTHSFGDWSVTQAPTCTEEGSQMRTCSTCGETETQSLPATNHSYKATVVAPNCNNGGYTSYTCSLCGDSYVTDEVAATGHSFENGTCTNCGEADPDYVKPSVVPTLTLKYPTVSFEDMILMNVYYAAENMQDVVDMGLVTYETKPDAPSVDTADEVLSGYTLNPSDGFYFSTTSGIAPKDLGDNVHFAIYAKLADGTYTYSKVASYSPQTYASSLLSTGTAEMKALVVAMLNYGAAAQSYFNYNTGSMMNGALTDAQKELVAAYNSDMITAVTQPSGTKVSNFVNDQTYTKRYPTISFEGAFCINYYFQPSLAVEGDVTMYVWSAEAFEAAEALTKENATEVVTMTLTETGEYLGVVEGIAAKDLDKVVYVAFIYSDGTTEHCGGVVAYSIGAYCKSQAATTGTMAELAKACAVYGYYAKQLFG